MSELQDTINQIMRDPEAMRQVQSLGEKLGLSGNPMPPSASPTPAPGGNTEMMAALSKLAPLMSSAAPNDETTALLNALKPFLSGEKLQRLQSAGRLIRLVRMIPLLRESGMFL